MAKNYYKILHIERSSDEYQIANAYRRLALQWHPNKNRDNIVAANHMFHQISEAYEVLSDPAKRSIYDQVGEFGLRDGVLTLSGSIEKYQYKGTADAIFEKFFGQKNPFFEDFEDPPIGSILGRAALALQAPEEDPPLDIVMDVNCTLEELFNGCTKQISYSRKVLNPDKISFRQAEESQSVFIRRGSQGQLIVKGQGNQSIKFPHSDLVLNITEVPHDTFRRNGNDLQCTIHVSLYQALVSQPIEIETLDRRVLSVSFESVITPETVKVIENEGMPLVKDNEESPTKFTYGRSGNQVEKGALYIDFYIDFPKAIPEDHKNTLVRILS